MSEVSASYQCTYIKDNEQYGSDLVCRTSDLIQRYSGTAASPLIPAEYDYTKTKPVLQILLTSVDPTVTDTELAKSIIDPTKWYINGVEIAFGNDGLSLKSPASFPFDAGTFKRIPAYSASPAKGQADYPFGGLQILKNLVKGLGGVNGVIKCEFDFVDKGGNMVTKQHTYTVGCREFATDGYELEVYTDGSTILDSTNTSVLLRARLWKGTTKEYDSKTMSNRKLRCYTYSPAAGDWAVIPASVAGEFTLNATTGELTVLPDAVPTFLMVMAAVFPSGSTETDYRKAEATDIIKINDRTDTLFIQPNPTPSDGVLRAGDSTPDGVTLAPKVYDKKTGGEVSGYKFRFVCVSPAGTIMNGTPSGSPGATGGFDSNNNGTAGNLETLTSYKIPRAMFEALGVGPAVIIHGSK